MEKIKKMEFILIGAITLFLMINSVYAVAGATLVANQTNEKWLPYAIAIGNIMILILFILLFREYSKIVKNGKRI